MFKVWGVGAYGEGVCVTVGYVGKGRGKRVEVKRDLADHPQGWEDTGARLEGKEGRKGEEVRVRKAEGRGIRAFVGRAGNKGTSRGSQRVSFIRGRRGWNWTRWSREWRRVTRFHR